MYFKPEISKNNRKLKNFQFKERKTNLATVTTGREPPIEYFNYYFLTSNFQM